MAETTHLEFARTPAHAGETVVIKPKGNFPAGTKFNGPSGSQQGWTASTNSDTGEIRVSVPSNATAGTTASFPVIVTFPDKSKQIHEVVVYVERSTSTTPGTSAAPSTSTTPTSTNKPNTSQADKTDLNFDNPTVSAGHAFVQRPSGNVPAGTKFNGPNGTFDGWQFTTDSNTGAVTITPPADAKSGASIDYTLTATFPDWSMKEYKLRATVNNGTGTDQGGTGAGTDGNGSSGSSNSSSKDGSSSSSSKEEGSSTGATIGIVVGVLALLGLLVGAANYLLPHIDIDSLWR